MSETHLPSPPGPRAGEASGAGPAGRDYLHLIVVLGFLTAVGPIAIDLYLPAFPTIAADLGVPVSAVELTLSAFLLGLAGGQLVIGPLSDRWGRRAPLIGGFALFSVGAVVCVLSQSVGGLVASRLLMGAGGAAGQSVPRAIVRDLFDGRAVAKALTLIMLVVGVAPVLAPSAGGLILRFFEWHALFWFQAGFGVLALLLSYFALPESLPPAERLGGRLGEVFRRYADTMRNPEFAGYTLMGAVTAGMLFAYIAGSPFVFLEIYGVSPQAFGILFGVNAVGLFSLAQWNHVLLRTLTSRQILLRGWCACVAASAGLVLAATTGWGGLWSFFGLTFILLATIGVMFPNIGASALNLYPRRAGMASALLGTVQYLGGAGAGIMVARLAHGTAVPLAGVMAACCVAGLAITLWLRRRERGG